MGYAPSATVYARLVESRRDFRSKTSAAGRRDLGLSSDACPSAAAWNVLLLGDPPFAAGSSPAVQLPPIPASREEVQAIAKIFPHPTVLLGKDASEEALVRLADSGALGRFDVLHLATHARIDARHPERSALMLSQMDLPDPVRSITPGTRIFDGRIMTREILREWKLNAEPVLFPEPSLEQLQAGLVLVLAPDLPDGRLDCRTRSGRR